MTQKLDLCCTINSMISCVHALLFCFAVTFVMATEVRCPAAPAPAPEIVQSEDDRVEELKKIAALLSKNAGRWVEISGTAEGYKVISKGVEQPTSKVTFRNVLQIAAPKSKVLVHLTPYTFINFPTSTASITEDFLFDGKQWLGREIAQDYKEKRKPAIRINEKRAYVSDEIPAELSLGGCGMVFDWTKLSFSRGKTLLDRFLPGTEFRTQTHTTMVGGAKMTSTFVPYVGTYKLLYLADDEISLEYVDKYVSITVRGKEVNKELIPREFVYKTNLDRTPDKLDESRITYTTDPKTGLFTTPLTITHTASEGGVVTYRNNVVITSMKSVSDQSEQISALYIIPAGWTISEAKGQQSVATKADYDIYQSGSPFAVKPSP